MKGRWVVKIGSALLTADGRGLDRPSIAGWVDQLAELHRRGIQVILVSSGSIAEGMARLRLERRPQALHELQALAAVGQMGLAQAYESDFQRHGLHTAQVLLTHDDFSSRVRYLNARSTLRSLLGFGVVPVVNENDTVSTEQIALGDNDTLAGLVANLMEAQLMVVLTDQDGLYSSDPRAHPGAELVSVARAGDPALEAMAGEGGSLGRGGMRSKLRAAGLAARSGTATRIVGGYNDGVLLRLADGEALGTLLEPAAAPMAARKRWMAGQVKTGGRLELDAGAAHMVRHGGKSLLAVGVRGVSGQFDRGEVVGCFGPDGNEVARGLVNYGASEVRRIVGVPSSRIAQTLGYVNEPELIHRDNLVMVD